VRGRHLAAAVLLRIVERRLDDAVGAELGDRLDRDTGVLAHGRAELVGEEARELVGLLRVVLELDPRVQILRVLAHDHDVVSG
jgi:hypothetical protein